MSETESALRDALALLGESQVLNRRLIREKRLLQDEVQRLRKVILGGSTTTKVVEVPPGV